MAILARCDKCGNIGDVNVFSKAVIYPPDVDPNMSLRANTISYDMCPNCVSAFDRPKPFIIEAGDVKWPGEEIKEPTGAETS